VGRLTLYAYTRKWVLSIVCYVTHWLSALFILLSITTLAVAQEPTTHSLEEAIDLKPGASCLTLKRLVASVVPYLSSDSIDSRIRIEVRGDPYRASVITFTLRRNQREYAIRRFDDAPRDCEQLHALIGLTLAFAIDATWLAKKVTENKQRPQSDDSDIKRIALAADALGAIGVVPGIGTGGDIRFEVGFLQWLDLRASLFSVYSSRQAIEDTTGTVDSLLLAARLDGCAGLSPFSWLKVRGCMGFAAGTFITHGIDYESSRTEAKLWNASASGVDWLFTLSDGLKLACAIDALFPTSRRVILVLGPDGAVVAQRAIGTVGGVARIGLLFFFAE
jgi:hypothetical protein